MSCVFHIQLMGLWRLKDNYKGDKYDNMVLKAFVDYNDNDGILLLFQCYIDIM